MTRGQDGSLLLPCMGLSPTITCQFVLAHSAFKFFEPSRIYGLHTLESIVLLNRTMYRWIERICKMQYIDCQLAALTDDESREFMET